MCMDMIYYNFCKHLMIIWNTIPMITKDKHLFPIKIHIIKLNSTDLCKEDGVYNRPDLHGGVCTENNDNDFI